MPRPSSAMVTTAMSPSTAVATRMWPPASGMAWLALTSMFMTTWLMRPALQQTGGSSAKSRSTVHLYFSSFQTMRIIDSTISVQIAVRPSPSSPRGRSS